MRTLQKNVFKMSILALLFGGALSININAQRDSGDYGSQSASFEATSRLDGDVASQSDGASVEHIKLLPVGNSTSTNFGETVAISGNTAVIGAYNDYNGSGISSGSATVFVRNGTSGWALQQKLTVDNNGNTVYEFGYRVAINGDTLFSTATGGPGAVYVFTRNGTTWTQQQIITAPDGAGGFGRSIAASGDTLVVGASWANPNGAAYIFVRNGSTWQYQQKITTADGLPGGNFFGYSVAISGDTVIVGAIADSIGSNIYQGSAYIFTRTGTTWTQQQKLTAADGATRDYFGTSVGISGDTAVVGADWHDVGGRPNQGAAYIFVRNGTTWSDQQKITAADGSPGGNLFGTSVAISGDMVIVGAYMEDIVLWDNRGAAHIFTRSGTTWTRQFRLFATDGAANDYLGKSVALDGNIWIVGVPDNNYRRGAAYIFDNSLRRTAFDFDGDSRADVSVFRPSSGVWYLNQSNSGFTGIQFGQNGDKMAPADYDGDGKTDVAVVRNGTWYILRSQQGFTGFAFGTPDDIPVPGDYDVDGKDDIAVFRPSTGAFFLQRSTAGYAGLSFGQAGDVPVPADYDGDGKTDLAIYRAGVWRVQRGLANAVNTISFGETTDKPVPADYDGDGKTDVAVFRPSNGTWYIQRSQAGLTGVQFGQNGDLPTPADYDGDGRADVAVFRNGTWFLNRSTNGFTGIAFGAATDRPLPNAFIP